MSYSTAKNCRFLWVCLILLLFNQLGCENQSQAPTQSPSPKEFVYPVSVGTQWLYSYSYDYFYQTEGTHEQRFGLHTWQITSVSFFTDSTVASVTVSRLDTVHMVHRYPWSGPGPYVVNQDTTYINRQSVNFAITRYSKSIRSRWTSMTVLGQAHPQVLENLLRYANDDTLKASDGDSAVWYLTGVGLVKYVGTRAANLSFAESLTFLKLTKM